METNHFPQQNIINSLHLAEVFHLTLLIDCVRRRLGIRKDLAKVGSMREWMIHIINDIKT
jgi:hypothetical protein